MRTKAGALATVAMLSLALAAPALAHPASTQTITSVIPITSFPSAPPFVETYAGTFTSSSGDSGTEAVQALFGAVRSPRVGVLQTLRTLTSSDGHSTLVLRCHQLATTQDFSTYPYVPDTGSCVVLSETGAYASLSGSGALNGSVLFDPSGTSGTLTDTLSLGG
jgi:hypothetical protein